MKERSVLAVTGLCAWFAIGAATGCSKHETAAAEPKKAALAENTASKAALHEAEKAQSENSVAGPMRAGATKPNEFASLADRFTAEAHDRPSGTSTVEQVFTALERAKVTFVEQRQHLASPFGARYCVGAKTNPDIAVSVCEFSDHKAAESGRETSLRLLSTVNNRELYLNGATLLTIRQGNPTPESQALTKKLAALFLGVRPTK